jgi:aspartate/methionine/tyrosine aminotransferase
MIERHGVAVHPGSFFGFREQNRLVVSLLTLPEVFAEGIARLVAESSQVT